MDVKLGYEVGSGEEVRVPVAHMVVTGQTQLSGKTTTLEALVQRAVGMRALAFVTKRGEGTFGGSGERRHLLRPYFRERADWQFVSAILEAETRERMKFERAWIMRATRAARTLDQVRKNIDRLQKKTKRAMDSDIYMQLAAYLDAVLPVLARVDFATSVDLRDGLNVVHLEDVPLNVQGLVISSMLSWVHERERDVTVILPESWKFIPQGRNSPVKMAAVSLAREGAGIGNLLWLDSQDIAGAEKEIVRQASVWLLGVQREANEIKRALGQMGHGIKKPTAAAVAQLERGQFYACWGTRAVRTYVQPAWMDDVAARSIATGEAPPFARPAAPAELKPAEFDARPFFDVDRPSSLAETWRNRGPYQGPIPESPKMKDWQPGGPVLVSPETLKRIQRLNEEEEMNADQEAKLDALVDGVTRLVERLDNPVQVVELAANRSGKSTNGTPSLTRDSDPIGVIDEDALVARVIARLKKEAPAILKVLVTRPELQVVVQRETIEADGKSLRGRIGRMIADGDFEAGMNGKAVHRALDRLGLKCAHPSVYDELNRLTEMGFFTLETAADKTRIYVATKGAKVNVVRK